MSNCAKCKPSGCCKDYSSNREMAPSLLEYQVVERILLEAMRKTLVWTENIEKAKRENDFLELNRLKDGLESRNETLVEWLTSTFSGENKHFATDFEWHPAGLANMLREQDASLASNLTDKEVLRYFMTKFVQEVMTSCEYLSSNNSAIQASIAFEVIATTWTNRLLGFFDSSAE